MKKICALLAAMALCLSVLGGAGMTASAAFGDLLSQPCDFSGYDEGAPVSGSEGFTMNTVEKNSAVVKAEPDGNKYLHVTKDGSSSLVLSYDFSGLVGENSYTLEYRLKPVSGSCNMLIGLDNSKGMVISHSSNSNKFQYVKANKFTDAMTSVPKEQWYQIRMTVNQSTKTMDCYVDGVLLCADIDQRNGDPVTNRFTVFVSGNGTAFGLDDFKVYSGELAAQRIEAVSLDFGGFQANDLGTLPASKVAVTMPNLDAGSIVQYDSVDGTFGKAAGDQSFYLRNDAGIYASSPDVRLNIGPNHFGRINEAGDREVLAFNCAFDEKLTPIVVNSYVWTMHNGAMTQAKFGGSAAEGYTVRLEADSIQLMGNHKFTLPAACVPGKWYRVELFLTAGSADGRTGNRFSAYLDSIPVCENVEMTDFRLRFDTEYEDADQFLGFSQIWLNHSFSRYLESGSEETEKRYEAGGVYFDDVSLTKYLGGEPVDAVPRTELRGDSPDFSKYTAGLAAWADENQTVADFRNGLDQSGNMVFRDGSGAVKSDADPVGGAYFDLTRADGVHMYGRVFGGSAQVVTEPGLIAYDPAWHQAGKWSSTKRSAAFEGRSGLAGRAASDESTVMQAPYAEGTPGNGIFDDYLDYSIMSDSAAKYMAGEACGPLHYESSFLLSGDVGLTVYLKVNASGTFCQLAQCRDGVIYGADSGVVLGSYENGQWYRLSASSYPGKNTADLRLNGVLIAENMELSTAVQYVSTFRFGVSAGTAEEDGYVAFDDVRIYAGRYAGETQVSVTSGDPNLVVEDERGYIVCEDAGGGPVSELAQRLSIAGTPQFFENHTFETPAETVRNRSVLVVNSGPVYRYYTIYTTLPDGYLSEFTPVFSNGQGSEVQVMPLDGTVTAALKIDNKYNISQDAVFVLAVYDEQGTVIGTDYAAQTIGGRTETTFEASVSRESFARCYAKVFLWDSLQSLVPLAVYDGLEMYNDIWMPSVFASNAVLQRDEPLSIWGKSAPYADIAVTLGDQAYQTTAQADGSWRVTAEPISTAQNPYTLSVESSSGGFRKFSNILAGEVWLCSGQSNMEWALSKTDNAAEDIASAANTNIRLFTQTRNGTEQEAEDVLNGSWKVCSPETVASFSGVGYLFGRELAQDLDVPVGLLYAAYGGARIECFISEEALADSPLVHRLSYEAAGDHNRDATHLYNGMIAPLIPYTIKGAIWYQGCANATAELHSEYLEAQKLMIQDWRERWGMEFPVLITQLAAYGRVGYSEYFPYVREAQWKLTHALEGVEMAVVLETGEENNIHPTDKATVGHRLALAAKGAVYGMDTAYRYPEPSGLTVTDLDAVVTFNHTYDGLVCDGAPAAFEIRDAAGNWYAASAEITGTNTVTVTDGIHVPVAVRCGFAGFPKPMVNLYNSAGLLITPFRLGDLGE